MNHVDDRRPNPEELLDRLGLRSSTSPNRGELKVILGAAPGVGKTFHMLADGHRLVAEGRDVVVGLVETHGRHETEAQIGDLEVLPRRTIEYRGLRFGELDVDGVILRAPDIVLIDELAHSNVPGSRNAKRWMDIETIRDAGIDVVTTLNIQHLESIKPMVESITGVTVRETVPDWVVADATDVQLVDIPVETLRDRLRMGKIYPSDRAGEALRSFFREGNLTALRELALRQTAATVDDRLEDYMRDHAIDAVWAASERVLVVVRPDVSNDDAIRRAWRLAAGYRAELLALAIVDPGDTFGRERLRPALQLAEDLGATTQILESRDPVPVIAQAARDVNASTIVMPYAPRTHWWDRSRLDLVDRLFRAVEGAAIHLVDTREAGRRNREQ